MSRLYVERVWLIECSRCSNVALFDTVTSDDAENEAAMRGWTAEDGDQYCPGCNGASA